MNAKSFIRSRQYKFSYLRIEQQLLAAVTHIFSRKMHLYVDFVVLIVERDLMKVACVALRERRERVCV